MTSNARVNVGRTDFLPKPPRRYNQVNNSGMDLAVPPHVNLNHLSIGGEDPVRSHVLVTITTSRFKNKCLTLIYYKPVN